MSFYLQLIILGLPIAGLFALLAVGVVMVYRATRILNLAQGGLAMFTAYALYWLHTDQRGPGVPLAVALPLALVFAAGMGWAMERFLLRKLRDRPVLVSVIMTVGVLAFLTAMAGLWWGYDRQDAPKILPTGTQLRFLGATLGLDRIFILLITAALMAGVVYLFKYTTLGIAMRAVSDDRRSALLQGIPADRISSVTWMLGSVLAGCAGILLSPIIGLQPINLGLQAIPAFAAALFGGLVSIPLTVAGALLIGIVFSLVPSLPVIRTSSFPGTREVVIFSAVILFLYFRGPALFGSDMIEEEI